MLPTKSSSRRWRCMRNYGVIAIFLLLLVVHAFFESRNLENLRATQNTRQEWMKSVQELEGREDEGLDKSSEEKRKELEHEPEALDDIELNEKNDTENKIESNYREQQDYDFDYSVTSFPACRLNLQHYITERIPKWMDDNVPIPMNSFHREDKTMYEVQFSVQHVTAKLDKKQKPEWRCSNQNASAPLRKTGGSGGSLIVQCPIEPSLEDISFHPPENTTPMNATTYDMRPFLKCDELFLKERPEEEIKMAACAAFLLPTADAAAQWVEYHKMIGVDHFWLYVHDKWNTSTLLQRPYITYIPFKYETIPFKQHWKKSLRAGIFNFQYDRNFECMARARQYNVEWLLMNDVDEFVHIPAANDTTKANIPAPILKDYLASQSDKVAAIEMNSIPYGSNTALKHPYSPADETLVLDYVWRRNQPVEEMKRGRWKNLVRPNLVNSVHVHSLHGIKKGYYQKKAKANEIRVDHFRRPSRGVFKTKQSKDLVIDSSLQDIYGERLRDALKDFKVFAMSRGP